MLHLGSNYHIIFSSSFFDREESEFLFLTKINDVASKKEEIFLSTIYSSFQGWIHIYRLYLDPIERIENMCVFKIDTIDESNQLI